MALELRYAIDVARRRRSTASIARVADMVQTYHRAFYSRHVQHNLGQERIDWLAEQSIPTARTMVAHLKEHLDETQP